jgi:hypothetical protein
MTELDELEPCPFCGAHLVEASDPRMAGMVVHPADGLPLCPIGSLHFLPTPEHVAAWNRRPSLSPAGVTEEQVEAALKARSAKFPHTIDTILGESGVIYPSQRDVVMRAALEAAAKAQPPAASDGWQTLPRVVLPIMLQERYYGSEIQAMLDDWNAAPSLPAGHVVVPVEPTEEMIKAGLTTGTRFGPKAMRNIYRAMLAALPHNQGEGK